MKRVLSIRMEDEHCKRLASLSAAIKVKQTDLVRIALGIGLEHIGENGIQPDKQSTKKS
jgi:predicted DNA-binding protein